jgi:hypothetical protein
MRHIHININLHIRRTAEKKSPAGKKKRNLKKRKANMHCIRTSPLKVTAVAASLMLMLACVFPCW